MENVIEIENFTRHSLHCICFYLRIRHPIQDIITYIITKSVSNRQNISEIEVSPLHNRTQDFFTDALQRTKQTDSTAEKSVTKKREMQCFQSQFESALKGNRQRNMTVP